MSGLKLSDLDPKDVQPADKSSGLKLSDLHPDDVKPVSQDSPYIDPQQVSGLEAGGRGLLQGATLGFGDEITGGAQALKHKILPEDSEKDASLKDLYKQFRDVQRSKNDAAKAQHPFIYGGSELAGGIAGMALAAPEAGLAGATALGAAAGLGSSNADLTEGDVGGALKDTAIGAGLGLAGGVVGQKVAGALAPEALEVAGSKMASRSVGLKNSKELARAYNAETGKVEQGSDIIKGIGKTAMNEGALPMTGGPSAIYDKSLDAIDRNYQKLGPIVKGAQDKLNVNPEESMEAAGHIGDKTAQFMYDFRNSLSNRSDDDKIMKGIEEEFIPYIQNKLVPADGNLQALVSLKRGLQDQATDLAAAAFDHPASDLKPKAEFVKRLSGIVRQHIEDLAGTVDPEASQAISDTNKTLSNLYTFNSAAKRLMDKKTSVINIPTLGAAGIGTMIAGPPGGLIAGASKIAIEKGTGNSIGKLGQMGAAKILNAASKVDTPAGQLVQKSVNMLPKATIAGPFTAEKVESKFSSSDSSKIATNLYNATNDSLKEVASKIQSTPGLKFYADHLNKAIDTNDEGEKNRAIFLILQNPLSRALVSPKE